MKVFIFSTFLLTIIHITKTANVEPTENSTRQNTSVPELENNFLKSIKKLCPQLASNKKLMDPKHLQQCKDWDLISSTRDLKDDSEQNILCLLYYDSFISFCEEMKKYNSTLSSNSDFNMTTNNNIDTICEEGLFPSNRIYKHFKREKINKKGLCYKLCTSYDNDAPVYECAMAHYFAKFNFSSLEKVNNASSDSLSLKKMLNRTQEVSSINVMGKNKSKNGTQSDEHQESSQTQVSVTHKIVAKFQGDEVQQQSNVPTLQPLIHNPVKPQESSSDPLVTQNTKSKPTDYLAASQAQKTPDQKDKKEAKGNTKMNGNPDQSQNNTAIEQEHISNNKQDNHDSGSSQNPQNDENHQQIQKGDAILKDSPMAPEEAEGNTKDDFAEEDNLFEEPEAENVDAGQDGEPVLPSAVEIPKQQDQDKPQQQDQDERPMVRGDGAEEIDGDSYFFSYFMVICVVFILGYVGYHNRLKVMALILEGKRNKRQYRGRRPNSANYHKLDCNLEEAISSNVTKNSSNVIY